MALPARQPAGHTPSVLPESDARALFDGESRRITGFTGDEFIDRWRNGEFNHIEDSPEGREIMYLLMLLPFGGLNS